MGKDEKKVIIGVLICVSAALLFNAGVWYFLGADKALEFLGGYLIEWSLSIDNIFVFLTIFVGFGVTCEAQHKALNFGIMGAIILRFIFIFFGLQLISKFEWLLYIFGVVLIINGCLMFKKHEKEADPSKKKILIVLRKLVPMTPDFVDKKFFVRVDKKLYATPLLAVVVLIEFSDIIFAMDSVPAIFSISQDLFIVYSSNIFAILGLRQLYFVLEHLHERFSFVKYGVGVLLIFTGIKLGVGIFDLHISTLFSICFILSVIVLSIVISMIVTAKAK